MKERSDVLSRDIDDKFRDAMLRFYLSTFIIIVSLGGLAYSLSSYIEKKRHTKRK